MEGYNFSRDLFAEFVIRFFSRLSILENVRVDQCPRPMSTSLIATSNSTDKESISRRKYLDFYARGD